MRAEAQPEFSTVVKKRLLDLELSITELAEELGFARNTVSIAINHPSMLPTVKEAIRVHLKLESPS